MKKIILFILFFFLFFSSGKAACVYRNGSYDVRITVSNSSDYNFSVGKTGDNKGYFSKDIVGKSGLQTEIDDFNALYLSESAINNIKNGICPEVAYYENKYANSLCIQNKSDGNYCSNIDAQYSKVSDIRYDNITKVKCVYENNGALATITEHEESVSDGKFSFYVSGTGAGAFETTIDGLSTENGSTWKVRLSEKSLKNLKNGKCPTSIYFEKSYANSICFQETADGEYCKSIDAQYSKVSDLTSENVYTSPISSGLGTTDPGTGGGTTDPGTGGGTTDPGTGGGTANPGTGGGTANPGTGGGTANPGTGGNNLDLNFCSHSGTLRTFRIIGICLIVLKILVPIILIIMGSLELGKAVIASDDKAISLAITSLTKKAIAAVIIFFVPSIIKFAFSLVSNFSSTVESYMDCTTCVNDIEECDVLIETAKAAGR